MLQAIVLLHELGHALAARLFGVRIREVLVGLGKPLARFKVLGAALSLRALPVGGGVDIDDDGYSHLARWQKAVIALAGPAANLLSAWLVPALVGVLLALFNGLPVWDLPWATLRGLTGSFGLLGRILAFTATGTLEILAGTSGDGLAGPVGIVAGAGKMPVFSLEMWLALFMVLSSGIAVFNLLPFPPLDGGRVLMSLAKGEKAVALVRRAETVGTALLVLMILALTAGDVISLFQS